MMAAIEYRGRAALSALEADRATDPHYSSEMHKMSRDWLMLADLAEWQDVMQLKGHPPQFGG